MAQWYELLPPEEWQARLKQYDTDKAIEWLLDSIPTPNLWQRFKIRMGWQ